MKKSYDIPIRGAAERRRVRAEIVKDGSIVARSGFIELGAGEERLVQLTLEAPAGEYVARQATNVGSNIHEDLVVIDVMAIDHRE